jgi:hypothetical protein
MLTVVEEMEPEQPRSWQEAAAICVSEIFNRIDQPLEHLQNVAENSKKRIISAAGPDEFDSFLNLILEGLSIIDNHFEGMVQTMDWFQADEMYWVEEWRILGSSAAAAGIKNGNLFPSRGGPSGHPEVLNNSASPTGVFDSWMLREEITETLIRKQSDYGHHNIARFGRRGLVVRTHDKIARLKNLHLTRSGQAANESLTDTYVDIVGYSAIGMMWERGWFLLDLTKN